jgi:hypothetical protein
LHAFAIFAVRSCPFTAYSQQITCPDGFRT